MGVKTDSQSAHPPGPFFINDYCGGKYVCVFRYSKREKYGDSLQKRPSNGLINKKNLMDPFCTIR